MSNDQSQVSSSGFKRKEPPNQQFYLKLCALEAQFNRKTASLDTIKQMICDYGRIIEFLDITQNPVMYYFMDQMQYVISHQHTIHELVQRKENQEEQQIVINKDSFADKHENEVYQVKWDRTSQLPNNNLNSDRFNFADEGASDQYRMSVMQKKRAVDIQLNLALENVKDVQKIIDEMQEEAQIKDKVVLDQFDVQMNNLAARLEQQKQRRKAQNAGLENQVLNNETESNLDITSNFGNEERPSNGEAQNHEVVTNQNQKASSLEESKMQQMNSLPQYQEVLELAQFVNSITNVIRTSIGIRQNMSSASKPRNPESIKLQQQQALVQIPATQNNQTVEVSQNQNNNNTNTESFNQNVF